MPTDSHYAAHCREVCKWCMEGLRVDPYIGVPVHIVLDEQNRIFVTEKCTAPTIEQFAEQQARIAEIRRVKLEHAGEALAKYRELVAGLDARLNEACKMLCGEKEHLNG